MEVKELHVKRLGTLIKFIEKSVKGNEPLALKRSEIADIVGVSEGDSLKAIFKMLNENPELYCDKITYAKEGKTNVFKVAENNIFSSVQDALVTLENVIPCGEGKYITVLPASKINTLWTEQIISYNPNIQRGSKTSIEKDGSTVTKDVCSEKNIKEIALKMIARKYFTDAIIINASNCELSFLNGELSIWKTNNNSEINVLDGQHRVKGIRLAEEISTIENLPCDLDNLFFPIQIETLTVESAQSAFSQFTKGLKISTTRSEYFNNADKQNVFLKDIIKSSKYNDQVEVVKDSIKNTDKLVSFGTLTTAFKENFSEKDLNDGLKSYLIKYFDILYDFISESNEPNSMLKENISYYGYISLIKKMYSKNIDLNTEYVQKVLSSVDYSKNSNLWFGKVLLKGQRGLSITNKKDTRKYISNVFEQLV